MNKMTDINFIAIDFETATSLPTSICEVGICVVRAGQIVRTRSWLIRPEGNRYRYWNIRIHGITPADTEQAPEFPAVWAEIERTYLDEFDLLVAHNVAFDRTCLLRTARHYNIPLPALRWDCTLQRARRQYSFACNKLDYLCTVMGIPEGRHHRAGDDAEMCARLYLREISDGQEG